MTESKCLLIKGPDPRPFRPYDLTKAMAWQPINPSPTKVTFTNA